MPEDFNFIIHLILIDISVYEVETVNHNWRDFPTGKDTQIVPRSYFD